MLIFFIVAFKYVCALIYLSSSGMWMAIMETGSSLSKDHPRMSESLRAWFTRLRFGTLAHVFGFMHCTFNVVFSIKDMSFVADIRKFLFACGIGNPMMLSLVRYPNKKQI